MYEIMITKLVENPNFETQQQEYEKRSRGYASMTEALPEKFHRVKQLETTLTDEEFAAIKKAVLEVM